MEKGKILLRISLSLVFLWFGISQLLNPSEWAGFVPQIVQNIFFNSFGITSIHLVYTNALLEIVFGLFLLIGFYTQFSSIVLALHLFGIAFSMGLSAIAIRDYGLALATLSVFFNKADSWCLDKKFRSD